MADRKTGAQAVPVEQEKEHVMEQSAALNPDGAAPLPAPVERPKRRRRRSRRHQEFKVTSGMRRYVQVICDAQCPKTELERCQQAKIGLRRLAIWRQQSEFEKWLEAEIHRLLWRRTAEVWNGLLREAEKGNVQAARLVVERFGEATSRRKAL